MTHNRFTRIDSNRPNGLTQNGFLKFDSNRLMTSRISFNKLQEYFDSNQLTTQTLSRMLIQIDSWLKKLSGILIRIKSWLNDSIQLFISLTCFGFSLNFVDLFGFQLIYLIFFRLFAQVLRLYDLFGEFDSSALIQIRSWLKQYIENLNRFNSWLKQLSMN